MIGVFNDFGGNQARSAWGWGSDALGDLTRDSPIGEAFGVKSSADIAAGEQSAALDEAAKLQEQGYQRSMAALEPYMASGGRHLDTLSAGVASGRFTPEGFSYSGQAPTELDYAGQPGSDLGFGSELSQLNYSGQVPSEIDYQGSPDVGSIQSFMGDFTQTPGYQSQLQEGQKAIDRAAAAGGRFGGGQTAKDLMRFSQGLAGQGYGAEYNRAAGERQAAMGAEQEAYGRGLTDFDVGRRAEQEQYGRAVSGLGFDRSGELEMRRREEDLATRGAGFEQDAYSRAMARLRGEQAGEATQYGRAVGEYGMRSERLANELAQFTGMAGMGQQAAGALSNAAIGQGSNLANLAIQQGNAQSAATMANSNQLGNLLDMAGQGAKLYGAT
jgi:hypothetical protein